MCESPLCFSEDEAQKLLHLAYERNLVFAMSYPLCFFSMIQYARNLLMNNLIGEIISIRVNYLQNRGILDKDLGNWKLNNQAGISYCFADLGIQSYQLIRYLTRMTPNRLSACLARSYNHKLLNHLLNDLIDYYVNIV